MLAALIVAGLVVARGWVLCPLVTCAMLDSNVCAQRTKDGDVIVNDSGCQDNYVCPFLAVLSWVESNSTALFACVPGSSLHAGENWQCEQRQALKNLAEGTYPKACISDDECTLMDGSTTVCACAARTSSSSGLCQPDKSSDMFEEYWEECAKRQVVGDPLLGLYFYLQQQYSVLYMAPDSPQCADRALFEFREFARVREEIASSAARWTVAAVVTLGM